MKEKRFAFMMTVEAKNGQIFELSTSIVAKSERTARLQALCDALSIGHHVLSMELCSGRASK